MKKRYRYITAVSLLICCISSTAVASAQIMKCANTGRDDGFVPHTRRLLNTETVKRIDCPYTENCKIFYKDKFYYWFCDVCNYGQFDDVETVQEHTNASCNEGIYFNAIR